MESLLVLFIRNSVDFLIFDGGQYLGKYLMDAKEKRPLVNERVPLYTKKWWIQATQNFTFNLIYCINSINKYCVNEN